MIDIADIIPDASTADVTHGEPAREDPRVLSNPPEQSDSEGAADLVHQLELERTRLRMLQDLSIALTSATETSQAALAILELASTALGATAGSVALLSVDGAEFHTIRSLGYPA